MASYTLNMLGVDENICACTNCSQAVWQKVNKYSQNNDYNLFDFPSEYKIKDSLCCWCQTLHMYISTPREMCDLCQEPDDLSQFIDKQ